MSLPASARSGWASFAPFAARGLLISTLNRSDADRTSSRPGARGIAKTSAPARFCGVIPFVVAGNIRAILVLLRTGTNQPGETMHFVGGTTNAQQRKNCGRVGNGRTRLRTGICAGAVV